MAYSLLSAASVRCISDSVSYGWNFLEMANGENSSIGSKIKANVTWLAEGATNRVTLFQSIHNPGSSLTGDKTCTGFAGLKSISNSAKIR